MFIVLKKKPAAIAGFVFLKFPVGTVPAAFFAGGGNFDTFFGIVSVIETEIFRCLNFFILPFVFAEDRSQIKNKIFHISSLVMCA